MDGCEQFPDVSGRLAEVREYDVFLGRAPHGADGSSRSPQVSFSSWPARSMRSNERRAAASKSGSVEERRGCGDQRGGTRPVEQGLGRQN